MVIGFNAKFLIEMLNVLDTDEVMFELDTPSRAGILLPTTAEENEDLLMLVMPVMLNY
jgi:DNA polymerase-3 subunit beta